MVPCATLGYMIATLLFAASARAVDPAAYFEPDDLEYWAPRTSATAPWDAPRLTHLTQEEFNNLTLDGKIFVISNISADWPLRFWDCHFFQSDPEFKRAAFTHQYAQRKRGSAPETLGADWQNVDSPSGAKNEFAPQIAPYYWGIKDVQYEMQAGWNKGMLKRLAKGFKVPSFMPKETHGSFYRTPEFWFGGMKGAGAKAHMDSHVQATLSLQIAGTKRWRLMPLRNRSAPFLGMQYQDGQPYENAEGWRPVFEIVLNPGDGLFFPPGMIHETTNIGDVCSASVTYQFDTPLAGGFYRRFFPRIRQTADIHESWVLIHSWARLGMKGDQQGQGAPYATAKADKGLEVHFKRLDKNVDGSLSLSEVDAGLSVGKGHAQAAMRWHDVDASESITLEEFQEGFAFWAGITHKAIQETPHDMRKYQLIGTIENLEDLPRKIAKKSLDVGFQKERAVRLALKQEL